MAELQKDLVLSPNEYSYVLDETKGNVACNVGPHKMSLSQSDTLVCFDTKTKKFIPCNRYEDAIQLVTTAPEGWYIALKNPAPGNKHPQPGTSNSIPENMEIGKKINIPGPISFALYPGQMAQVIQGHTLRSNQYLVAKVYDADSLNTTKEDRDASENEPYFVNGQVLIIKGTEISFYIPPTGIEVKAINNDPSKGYVRDAVTLERLEYCILKDEDGNKRYVHGPTVVFPEPTESFIKDGGGYIKRNAIELSDISGVYVKVVADYKDDNGKEHKTGEELFITGKDQMIYYPRPEHTFITYNGKVMHHAIAIPKGEGRYIMNRMTGEIKTVRGPAMYLPDPRIEVAIKRTLSRSQCELWYPGNVEVLEANGHPINLVCNDEFEGVKTAFNNFSNVIGTFADPTMTITASTNYNGTPTKTETNKINRTNTFTPPRTISLDSSKYEGAVAVDIWTGYAVNVISKDGTREVIVGPQTILLDYDQTLEALELSTGKPKTTDRLEKVVFLRCENNRVSDVINVETSDFVQAQIKVSYLVDFDKNMKDRWFSVDNYVKHMCDWCRSAIKRAAKEFSIRELHDNYHDIVVEAITTDENTEYLHKFMENGMQISDVEVLSINIESNIQALMDRHQEEVVSRSLELAAAQASAETEREIIALNREKVELAEQYAQYKAQLEADTKAKQFELIIAAQKARDEEDKRKYQIEQDIQVIKDAIFEAERARKEKDNDLELAHKKQMLELEATREAAAAEAMKTVLTALGPDLAAALKTSGNQAVVESIAGAIAPYAIAEGKPVSRAVSELLRGTTLESVFEDFAKKND